MKKIIKELRSNPIFSHSIVGDFKDSKKEYFECCTFDGVNGDELKSKYYKKYYSIEPSSCDVIKILDINLDFIEFKTLGAYDKDYIEKRIDEFELIKKIEGSYDLLKKIIENDDIKEINKLFIISVHLHGSAIEQPFLISGKINFIKEKIEEYFNDNPLPFGENFLEPRFIRTEDINNLYK